MVSRVTPGPKPPKARHGRRMMTGITLIGQIPALEHTKEWRLWLAYDDNYRNGVFLQLCDDGAILRCVMTDGRMTRFDTIKEED